METISSTITIKIKNMSKQPGKINSISIHMNNMKIDTMLMKDINLFVGANRTGKTFVLIMAWISGMCINVLMVSKLPKNVGIIFIQQLLDGSFDNQNFTGTFEGVHENTSFSFVVDNGKVTGYSVTIPEEVTKPQNVIFMSKNTRTFSDMERYCKMKDMFIKAGKTNEEALLEMGKLYKIYDIIFIEQRMTQLTTPLKINDITKAAISSAMIKTVDVIGYEPSTLLFFYIDAESAKIGSLAELSAGEQSIINMYTVNQ
jgi:hypothetical protein